MRRRILLHRRRLGEDGNIIASLRVSGGLSRVSAAGGSPTPVTELEGEERTHRWPQILPGGKAILFTVENSTVGFDDAKIDAVTVADHRRKTLQGEGTFGRYLAASGGKGYLTYVNRGTLFAVPFDPEKLEASGSPMPGIAAGFFFYHVWLGAQGLAAAASPWRSGRHFLPKKLLVTPRFFDHLRKHSLAQPSLKRSLGVLQQLCHCLFMSATRAARLFFWILVNRQNKRCLYCFVNFQQTDLICWPRQR